MAELSEMLRSEKQKSLMCGHLLNSWGACCVQHQHTAQ